MNKFRLVDYRIAYDLEFSKEDIESGKIKFYNINGVKFLYTNYIRECYKDYVNPDVFTEDDFNISVLLCNKHHTLDEELIIDTDLIASDIDINNYNIYKVYRREVDYYIDDDGEEYEGEPYSVVLGYFIMLEKINTNYFLDKEPKDLYTYHDLKCRFKLSKKVLDILFKDDHTIKVTKEQLINFRMDEKYKYKYLNDKCKLDRHFNLERYIF